MVAERCCCHKIYWGFSVSKSSASQTAPVVLGHGGLCVWGSSRPQGLHPWRWGWVALANGPALQWDRSVCEGETEAGMGVDGEMVTDCGGHQEGAMWGPHVT